MTKIIVQDEIAEQIRSGDGPIDLVDESGKTLGRVYRPPSDADIARAKTRASQGGPTLTWAQVREKIRAEMNL